MFINPAYNNRTMFLDFLVTFVAYFIRNILSVVLVIFILYYWTNRRYDRPNGYSMEQYTNSSPVTNFVRTIKRNMYFSKNKNISKNTPDQYRFFNTNVILIYEKREKKIKCIELKGNLRKLSDTGLYNSTIFNPIDIYDDLIKTFDYKTTFSDIEHYFDQNNIDYIIKTNKRKNDAGKIKKQALQLNTRKIDINQANESELASLPGINIIYAKKIIQKRDLKGGFKTTDDFISILKLKEHFLEQIKELIVISDYNTNKNSNANINERTIDL